MLCVNVGLTLRQTFFSGGGSFQDIFSSPNMKNEKDKVNKKEKLVESQPFTRENLSGRTLS